MKKSYQITAVIVVILSLLTAWLINMDILPWAEKADQKNTALDEDGNACVAIAEKSVSHLSAVVDFQKLEIIGRKARVMRNCMDDHGYLQNPAWVTYATPIAKENARKQQISMDEAFENVRRQAMVVFHNDAKMPLYWTRSPIK